MKLSALCLVSTMAVWVAVTTYSDTSYSVDGLLDPGLIELYRGSNINPFDVNATNNLALKMIRQGRYERARKLLTRARRLDPAREDIAKNEAQLNLLLSQMKGLDLDTTSLLSNSYKDKEIEYIPAPWNVDPLKDEVNEYNVVNDASPTSGRSNPFDSRSLITTARIKVERGDARGALRDLQRAKRLSPWLEELDSEIALLESQLSNFGGSAGYGADDVIGSSYNNSLVDPAPPGAWVIEQKAPADTEVNR